MKAWKRITRLLRSLQWKLVYIFVSMCIILVVVVYIVINAGLQTIYFDNFKSNIDRGYDNWRAWKGVPASNSELVSYFEDKSDFRFFGVNDNLSITIIDTNAMNSQGKGILYSSDTDYGKDKDKFSEQIFNNSENLRSIWAGNGFTENRHLIKAGSGQTHLNLKQNYHLVD